MAAFTSLHANPRRSSASLTRFFSLGSDSSPRHFFRINWSSTSAGPARVREELRRRGVDRSLWDEALEELPEAAEVLDQLIPQDVPILQPDQEPPLLPLGPLHFLNSYHTIKVFLTHFLSRKRIKSSSWET